MKMKDKTRHNKRIRKGDKVVITAGNDRGEVGTVLSRTEARVIVQGVNVRKKHVKKTQENPNGGIIEIERPIHISNLRLAGSDDKPVKVRSKTDDQGQRTLYYRDGAEEVVVRAVKKSQG